MNFNFSGEFSTPKCGEKKTTFTLRCPKVMWPILQNYTPQTKTKLFILNLHS